MAIMVKQMHRLVNSIVILIVISCNQTILEHQSKKTENIDNNQINIVIDSSINSIILRDTVSLGRKAGNINYLIEEDYNKGECATLTNKFGNEYLMLKRENGGYGNQYNYFFVQKTIPLKFKTKRLNDEIFISNNGAFIGMPENDFLKKYADIKFEKETRGDTLSYIFINDIYKSKYIFLSKNLIEFEFGYQD